MARFIPDIHSERWVIIAPGRIARPDQTKAEKFCVFCPGNENLTPPEVYRVGGGNPNHPGWAIRVVPNKALSPSIVLYLS
jgi:UDPglucose--hexose-1-phosphate uridylyltransferase